MTIDDATTQDPEQLAAAPVVLFMKGTPDFPQCGFSAQTVGALRASRPNFRHVNIFEDPELRDALKKFLELADLPAALRERRAGRRLRHRDRHAPQRRAQEAACRKPARPPEASASRLLGFRLEQRVRRLCGGRRAREPLGRAPRRAAGRCRPRRRDRRCAPRRRRPNALRSNPSRGPQPAAACDSTVCPNAAPASVAVSKQENG